MTKRVRKILDRFPYDGSRRDRMWGKHEQKSPRLCYGCKHLNSEWDGAGGTTFKCGRVPGLVVGYVGAFDNDEPHEANNCYETR